METEVQREIEFDGTNWYIKILGKKIGPPRTKVEATDILKWFNEGGLQDTLNVAADIIEKAFKEEEARKNG